LKRTLVLASASPRRQALVRLLNLPWRAAPVEIQEQAFLVDEPLAGALNVAAAKARTVPSGADEVVLAADTLVVADDAVLGKPATSNDALEMLRALRGRPHQVITGVALRAAEQRQWGGVVSTQVVMRDYADAEIEQYIARGEPFDKAGGYAIQDELFRPVARLDGCYLNVVGLPLCAVAAGLLALGVEVRPAGLPPCTYCGDGAGLVSIG
jgi:MAF protein